MPESERFRIGNNTRAAAAKDKEAKDKAEKAKQQGYDVNIGNFPFIANGKALALGEDEGFIKTIFDKNTGELLGAHMVGAEVTELLSTYIVGKGLETTPDEFLSNIFPHPTMSEMLYESVLSSESKAIHY